MPPMLLPSLCAFFNGLAFVLLILGYRAIKSGERERHEKLMVAALASSTIFLGCYVANWFLAETLLYPYQDWTRALYFIILVPHVILAALMTPFIIALVIFAWKESFLKHAKLARVVWPVWVYVSITGVMVFLMLRVQPLLREPPPQPEAAAVEAATAP